MMKSTIASYVLFSSAGLFEVTNWSSMLLRNISKMLANCTGLISALKMPAAFPRLHIFIKNSFSQRSIVSLPLWMSAPSFRLMSLNSAMLICLKSSLEVTRSILFFRYSFRLMLILWPSSTVRGSSSSLIASHSCSTTVLNISSLLSKY